MYRAAFPVITRNCIIFPCDRQTRETRFSSDERINLSCAVISEQLYFITVWSRCCYTYTLLVRQSRAIKFRKRFTIFRAIALETFMTLYRCRVMMTRYSRYFRVRFYGHSLNMYYRQTQLGRSFSYKCRYSSVIYEYGALLSHRFAMDFSSSKRKCEPLDY